MTVDLLCQCSGPDCREHVQLPQREADGIGEDLTLIVATCRIGAAPGAVLVEKRDGYSLYREPEDDGK